MGLHHLFFDLLIFFWKISILLLPSYKIGWRNIWGTRNISYIARKLCLQNFSTITGLSSVNIKNLEYILICENILNLQMFSNLYSFLSQIFETLSKIFINSSNFLIWYDVKRRSVISCNFDWSDKDERFVFTSKDYRFETGHICSLKLANICFNLPSLICQA